MGTRKERSGSRPVVRTSLGLIAGQSARIEAGQVPDLEQGLQLRIATYMGAGFVGGNGGAAQLPVKETLPGAQAQLRLVCAPVTAE